MKNSREDLQELCRACGLCCDGSLFNFVRLDAIEVASARKIGLPVVSGGKGLVQPCTMNATMNATVNATMNANESATRSANASPDHGCHVYDVRPTACRAFVCRLLAAQRDLGGPVEPRLAIVRRARALLRDPVTHATELDAVMPHFDRTT